jgi:hypothetical protein
MRERERKSEREREREREREKMGPWLMHAFLQTETDKH